MIYREPAVVCEECKKKSASPKPQMSVAKVKMLESLALVIALTIFAITSLLVDTWLFNHHILVEPIVVVLAIVEVVAGFSAAIIVGIYISTIYKESRPAVRSPRSLPPTPIAPQVSLVTFLLIQVKSKQGVHLLFAQQVCTLV